jgi:hypothetical protein
LTASPEKQKNATRTADATTLSARGERFYTFNACISRPIAITNHSPGPVECPVFSVIEFIYGDHAIFDISPPLV